MLEVKGLCMRIGETSILENVSLSLAEGRTLALVGESGSGKSMTAQSIIRLLPQQARITQGSVRFLGQSLLDLKESQMQLLRGSQIGMIFQEPNMSLNPVLTIGHQVAESLKIHTRLSTQQIRQRVLRLLQEVQLDDAEKRLNWYPHQLSGGQKQRVMIAIAMACEPKLLIADEPTTALDLTIQAEILKLIKQLQQQRSLSLLLITHDMGIVAQMSDDVAVMREGRIIEYSDNQSFFKQPQHEYSNQLLDALPSMHQFRAFDDQQPLVLEVKNLHIRYPIKKGLLKRTVGFVEAAKGLSFSLKQQEVLAIVGESGSGKSTIGKAILRLLDRTAQLEGQMIFQGRPVHALSQRKMRTIRHQLQIIFQDPYSSLNPRFTIRQTLSEGMLALAVVDNQQQADQRCVELMQQVGLHEDLLSRYPNEFSGGQRQRIAIARALAVRPKVIICDEPTSALDVCVRQSILKLLIELQQQHQISLIFITHDLSLIPKIAHRVLVMKQGQVVEIDSAQKVLNEPQQLYTKTLIEAIPALVWSKQGHT